MMHFSICHTTARPNGWQESFRLWTHLARFCSSIEYVLCVDERWGFSLPVIFPEAPPGLTTKLVWNTGRRCSVDGWNIAATNATGSILILNSDDMFPPDGWDELLLQTVSSLDSDFVIEVSSGTKHDRRRLMVLGIMSRVRYQRLGYAYYPEYLSMACDDDFGEHARRDNVVIDARHLVFSHQHASYRGEVLDAAYQWQNRAVAIQLGNEILARRRHNNFSA